MHCADCMQRSCEDMASRVLRTGPDFLAASFAVLFLFIFCFMIRGFGSQGLGDAQHRLQYPPVVAATSLPQYLRAK